MAYEQGASPRRSQAFENAAYLMSGEEYAEQGPSCWYPLYEHSQGFELGPLEERDPQLVYSWVADPHFTQNPWPAMQEGVDNSGDWRPLDPRHGRDPLPSWSHQAAPGSTAVHSVQQDTTAVNTSVPSSAASTKSAANGSSGSTSSCRRSDGSSGSDEAAQRPRGKSNAVPPKPQEQQVSWATCVSVILMALMVTTVLLLSLSVMVRMNRMMASASVGQLHQLAPQKAVSAAPAPTGQQPKRPYERRESGLTTTNGSSPPTRSARPAPRTPTSTAQTMTLGRTTSSQRRRRTTHMASPAFTSQAPAADNENVEAGDASEDHMAFPFQHPTRPMCGDVFYTVCQSSQHEFHYRRSTNACVETAADAVHSCNRGTNRFTSLRHCAQSCLGTRRPADQCFSMPLFTSCARQDVLSSWWFFQGRKCVPWSFPSGGCPEDGSSVFRTAVECRRRCVGPVRGRRCRPPRAVACDRRHLKYPFFADLSMKDGRLKCRRSSPEELSNRRCLIGANRFRNLEACMVTCKNRPRA